MKLQDCATPRFNPLRTWLGALNFLVLQWFGVRLARHVLSVSPGYTCDAGGRIIGTGDIAVRLGWVWLGPVLPLSGWWGAYVWLRRRAR